jgi:DNA mismatch repair protein MutS2
MEERSLKVLEFYNLLEALKTFSVSPLGQKRCEALRPSGDVFLIRSRLTEVIELKEILETVGTMPIQGLKDIEAALKKVEVEGAVLTVQELIDVSQQIALARAVKRFFSKLETGKFPRLQEKISNLSSFKELERKILRAIDPEGEIVDEASPALSEIRHQMGSIKEKAKGVLEHLFRREELQSIFQEQLITLRNGRYVVPIKSDSKHRLEGIVHGQSQSRMTFFFEPLQVVELNNEIHILMGEEREEEYRILAELSQGVREELPGLWTDFEILGDLDLLYAMAKLSIRLKGVQPLLNEDGKIDMEEARNPLLVLQKGEDQVIPVHLRMGDGVKVLVLSGANAGGKTVALKTMGILILMAQSGLPIPVAEGSRVAVFRDIFAVIGDEQNIEENLSTFSGHLLHVNQVLEKAGPSSLVLLDELGVGTHAQEGCALAMGFLDQFREKGASTVVTTHFDRLKVYGYLHRDVENVAVRFDEETLEPKYTLSYGSSGLSNAFLVAEKLAISRKVLERASHYQDGGEEEVSRTLAALERLKAEAGKERQELLDIKREIGLERQRLKDLLGGIKKRRQEILAQVEEKVRRTAEKAEEELRALVHEHKEEKAPLTLRHLNTHRREIQEVKEKFLRPVRRKMDPGPQTGFRVGERVRIESLRSTGILSKVEEPIDRAEVTTEKGRVKTSLSDLARVRDEEGEGGPGVSKGPGLAKEGSGESPSQLNVIGLTVEDALPVVDKFIDQALLHGLEKIHVIHGMGSGRLRDAIRKYLQGHQGVKGFSPGDGMRGGSGITVVELE